MVGAGTVRIDDPQLTVRPHRSRRVPYTRVVVCERDPVPASCRVFASPADGGPAAYRRTIVLAPAGSSERFAALEHVAEVLYVGEPDSRNLDLARALIALRDAGIASVLCEGGPTLAARLLEHDLVDRLEWLIAPALLCNAAAVPTLAVADVRRYANGWRFDRVERLGDDLLVSAPLAPVAALAARGREEPARV
jgi:diaminohydroxyphosphoribosylaminopyrimidine deaminase/5-amino-6-(5-phosphoribosylamino)uracil reductase